MKSNAITRRNRIGFCLAVLCLVAVLAPLPTQALVQKDWVGGDGWWDDAGNWSPPGQPRDSNQVFLGQTDALDRVVNYRNTAFPGDVLWSLSIKNTGSGKTLLSQAQDTLSIGMVDIGVQDGTGYVDQSGGVFKVSGTMQLYSDYADGADYSLRGTGYLSAGTIRVGMTANGSFR
jgi:hypothetical protein